MDTSIITKHYSILAGWGSDSSISSSDNNSKIKYYLLSNKLIEGYYTYDEIPTEELTATEAMEQYLTFDEDSNSTYWTQAHPTT
jgi:hypothetical protein